MESHKTTARPWRVLIWPGGTEIGLEIRRALRDHKEVELIGGGSSADNHIDWAYERRVRISDVSSPQWTSDLDRVVKTHKIDYVFPAHDDVITALAKSYEVIDVTVVSPPPGTCKIVRSKRQTYAELDDVIPVPKVYAGPEQVECFPVFAKPDSSQGSRGAHLVRTMKELEVAIDSGSDLVMEYLPGDEFTVDCFSDRDAGLTYASARWRRSVRSGISGVSEIVTNQQPFIDMAARISDRLSLRGPWFFQVREAASGELTLLEVGARVSGTMALHRVLGVNFPLLALYEAARLPIVITPQNFAPKIFRPLSNRYSVKLSYKTVYCDLDDMLISRGRVNPRVVAFLYEALNRGCRLELLTRHASDVPATLTRYRLQSIFDKVTIVPHDKEKADYMVDPNAIFLDDSFSERQSVHRSLGIPTFDSSSLELLREDRA